ncbi:hypothetical protein M6B38_340375 [Iris pallida]|uniref:Uncharacterized protein n=1 Tax=Iris pallida TaxID=29817 RepID=A0AAX6GXY5_IRIPA|nr:hypothetical protein M6B38_237715 [Iris pallida]KAJ6820828.1 hypothetical protein M6B38_395590 [Iris pallida]KAJ6820829.1 hypothetical protein M6B38_395595 [Iris pallida]KAJ6833290.1 hypothetical protein M6B38_341310 [Iris pallida]KAJ6833392.1 hypothetical protein M6B38_340370 [Iris pallida]
MIVIMGELASPPVHNNVLITPQSTCRMQVSSAGAELPSNVLRRGAISGALERYKELKHPIQDIMYRNIAMNHSIL